MKMTKAIFSLFIAICVVFASQPLMAQAAPIDNQKTPFQAVVTACSGEQVSVTGIQHLVGHTTVDGTGQIHLGININTTAKGVGATTGDKYNMSLNQTIVIHGFQPGKAQIFTQNYTSKLIHLGKSNGMDDTKLHMLTHIVFDASGNMTADVSLIKVSCKQFNASR